MPAGLRRAALLNATWSTIHALLFIGVALGVVETGGPDWLLGAAALAYDASYILVSPLAGRLGDERGRKKPIAASIALLAASATMLAAGLALRDPLLVAAAKLPLGLAGGVAIPNLSALIVDLGVVTGRRPEELLSRYYGSSSTLGWLIGYLGGGVATRSYGLTGALILIAAPALTASTILLYATPTPPLRLEHSVPVARARVRLPHERVMRAHLPSARRILERLTRTPLLWFYASVATGFAGIAVFFSLIPSYWVRHRGLTESDVMIAASVHTLTSTLTFLAAHRLVTRLGPAKALATAFAARTIVFYSPLLTQQLLPPFPQALATYAMTGTTWALLNTSLNTLALEYRVGGRGARLGLAQSASSTGLVAGDALSTLLGAYTTPTTWFTVAALLEATAAILTLTRLARQ